MSWIVFLSLAGAETPAIDVSAGVASFSPANRPHWLNPSLDGQVDVSEFVPGAPWLGASGGTQLGLWLPRNCSGSCRTQGRWGLGVGPSAITRWVDVALLGRFVVFGSSTDVRPVVQATGKIPLPESVGPDLSVRPFLAVEGFRYPDLQIGVRVGTRLGSSREPSPTEIATVAGGGVGVASASCPNWTVVGASMSPALMSASVLASMSTTEVLERRLALEKELAELEAIESSHLEMEAFRSSLGQIKDVLKDNAEDTKAATEKIDEIKESVEKFTEVVEEAKKLLRTEALDGVLDAAEGTSNAYGEISEGVGKLGEKSTEAAEAIDKLSSMLDKLNELQEMDATQSDDLIREFGGMIGGLADVLGPFVDLVPGVGAFLQIYTMAIESIAGSVESIQDTMLDRNLQARRAGLSDVYTFTQTATQKRRCRISELRSELGQLELETAAQPADTPRELTAQERSQLTDARNAFEEGLRASGIGDDAATPYDGWSQGNRRLYRARNRLALAHGTAERRSRGIVLDRKELEKAKAEYDEAKEARDTAQQAYDDATTEGASSGARITRTLDELDEAKDAFNEAERDYKRWKAQVDRYAEAIEELKEARTEYAEAHEAVDEAFDAMIDALPEGSHFDPAREILNEQHSPNGSFHESAVPKIDAFIEGLP